MVDIFGGIELGLEEKKKNRWRGSIYKLVWLDLLMFLLLYYVLNMVYRLALDEHGKEVFEGVVYYCSHHGNVIPLSFVLGFYVTVVMNRWWSQYVSIPWPDPIAVFVSANIHGQDERGRLMRRTIMRYVCLCLTMVLTMISPRVKKRFPSLDQLVESGLLLDNEKSIMEDLNNKFPKHSKHWLPIVWAASIVTRARKEGRIRDDFAVKTIIDELNKFRGNAGLLISYDTISVPLVYTQVVTLAVYSYFITSAMGSQWTDSKVANLDVESSTAMSNVDLYFPIFSTLEFFFYMGWLKVAESLINPFGEDDDDFEVNWLIDRDLQVSYMIVDEMHHEHPELIKDQYWDEVFPSELPYTIATEGNREEHPEPSTARISVPQRQRSMVTVTPSAVRIEEMAGAGTGADQTVSYKFPPPEQLYNEDAQSGIHFSAPVRSGSKRGKPRDITDRNSYGSSNSMATTQPPPPLNRVNSVTNVLKRLFSREDQNRMATTPTNQVDGGNRFFVSASNVNLTGSGGGVVTLAKPMVGSMKIANDVIEEVDEQNTITSNAHRTFDVRPTAESIFAQGPPAASAPVDVPARSQHRQPNNVGLSTSAPQPWTHATYGDSPSPIETFSLQTQMSFTGAHPRRSRLDSDVGPSLSAAGSNTLDNENEVETASATSQDRGGDGDGGGEAEQDEFDRLRSMRELQRKEKYLQRLMARSVSAQQGGGDSFPDNEVILDDLTRQSDLRTANATKSKENLAPDKERSKT